MKREEYRKFQWLASVCIAVFILSFAVCLLAFNRSVYRLSSTDYRNGVTVEISKAEAELYYGQIADSYCRFFTGKYRIAGYELSDENVHQLNRLNLYLCQFPFLFFPGSGTEEKSVCKAEPGHVFTAFSGICGDVSENRR